MSKPAKTQWDFGDLFGGQLDQPADKSASEEPDQSRKAADERKEGAETGRPRAVEKSVATNRKILSVSELTSQIKRLLEGEVGMVWVTGEISNLKTQNS